MILKEVICKQCLLLGGCGGLERTEFEQFVLWEGVVVLERSDFEQFLLWDGVVVWWS